METNGLRRLEVLVVDDEALVRWSVADVLTAGGHHVREAGDAASARRVVAADGPPVDVVLLDLRLPDCRDLTLLEDIRRLAPHSAVVVMTSHGTPDLAAAALALGARAVIAKPFDVDGLEPLLRRACPA